MHDARCVIPVRDIHGDRERPVVDLPALLSVTNEITEAQLAAEAVYMGMLETPVRIPVPTAAAQTRVDQGEALFNQVGCQFCHRQNMTINVPVHVEPADTTGGAGTPINVATPRTRRTRHSIPTVR
jgi:hypothetical protein